MNILILEIGNFEEFKSRWQYFWNIWPREIIYLKFYSSMTSIWKIVACEYLLIEEITQSRRHYHKVEYFLIISRFPKSRWSSTPTSACPTTSPRPRRGRRGHQEAGADTGGESNKVTRKVKEEEEHHHDGSSRHDRDTEIFAERASIQFKTYSLKFLEDSNVVLVFASGWNLKETWARESVLRSHL